MVRRESQVRKTEGVRIWMLRPIKHSQHCLPRILPEKKHSGLLIRGRNVSRSSGNAAFPEFNHLQNIAIGDQREPVRILAQGR